MGSKSWHGYYCLQGYGLSVNEFSENLIQGSMTYRMLAPLGNSKHPIERRGVPKLAQTLESYKRKGLQFLPPTKEP